MIWRRNRNSFIKRRRLEIIRHTPWILIVVSSTTALVVCLWTPVIHVYGKSLVTAMTYGDIELTAKGDHFKLGNIVIFDYNHRNLGKRVIAKPGTGWIWMKTETFMPVDLWQMNPAWKKKHLPDWYWISLQVWEKHWFVIADHHSVPVNSRSRSIGTAADDQITGKIIWRLWPLYKAGPFYTARLQQMLQFKKSSNEQNLSFKAKILGG